MGRKEVVLVTSAVAAHLQSRGISHEVIPHTRAFTSISEAAALGIDADEVLKTIVLQTSTGRVLGVIPGSRRLDMRLVHHAVDDPHARLETEEELERELPGYELGAFPPIGSLLEARLFVDPEVMAREHVVFAAGSQTESIRARVDDLFKDEDVHVVPLARQPDEEEDHLA
jgi:prolyl-tRNA editing enzyme YbaK/EbsC (Cys-tRNA(Pro) deacylase)